MMCKSMRHKMDQSHIGHLVLPHTLDKNIHPYQQPPYLILNPLLILRNALSGASLSSIKSMNAASPSV